MNIKTVCSDILTSFFFLYGSLSELVNVGLVYMCKLTVV